MIVVADSSPLIVLINIGYVEILPKLFGRVVIPPEVSDELKKPNRPKGVRSFIASAPSWLNEQTPKVPQTIPALDPGEAAAISLALELEADLVLIDETAGRRAAAERHLRFTGTIGILEQAARQGYSISKTHLKKSRRQTFGSLTSFSTRA
jgi:predicted nucleic acid-binding protein